MSVSPAAGRLILIGYRGCGKTTIGRLVAQRLAWDFVDTDEVIQQDTGRTIRQIFDTDGESAFRALERSAVFRALERERCVVSVGGGAVVDPEIRGRLRGAGVCVWLTAPPAELQRRIESDARSADSRPALTDASGIAEIERVLAARLTFYRETADHEVDTAGHSLDDLVEEVVALVPAV